MSADEIRWLAGEQPGDMTATDVNCIDISEDVRAALLAYAAMVERCEKTRTQLELNKKDYANRGVCGSLVKTNNDEIAMIDYIEKGKQE